MVSTTLYSYSPATVLTNTSANDLAFTVRWNSSDGYHVKPKAKKLELSSAANARVLDRYGHIKMFFEVDFADLKEFEIPESWEQEAIHRAMESLSMKIDAELLRGYESATEASLRFGAGAWWGVCRWKPTDAGRLMSARVQTA